ncbi:MAG TPA: methyltransferase domain-containing protein [Gemmatimonadaceae bacterium]|nr:methyltransferase domain-containing protein [Gemmatimonadaceae bacterium]
MRQLRREAYGEDFGQHSWVVAEDLRNDINRLRLSGSSHLLDLGSGPCGPLTFVLAASGCRGTAMDLSPSGLDVGRARARTMGVDGALSTHVADLNEPIPLESRSFDAIMSLDVILHLRDRSKIFHEVARLLRPGGRFLFTDAGVVTGSISSDDVRRRSFNGYTQFVPVGWNESLLESAGLRLLESENRTMRVLENAGGRLATIHAHRDELERVWTAPGFENQRDYLETVVAVSQRGAISRFMYLAEVVERAPFD